jgi:hypothetical protein
MQIFSIIGLRSGENERKKRRRAEVIFVQGCTSNKHLGHVPLAPQLFLDHARAVKLCMD